MKYSDWPKLLDMAKPLVDFLTSDKFFDKPYNGVTDKFIITSDIYFCMHFMAEHYDEWEDIKGRDFDENFEWHSVISSKMFSKNNYFFGILDKDFGSVVDYFQYGADFREIMPYDIKVLFNCYANDYFPDIWQDILYIYLHNGFPCGWYGNEFDGKIIVYSCNT